MLLRDVLPGVKLSNTAWWCIGLVCVLLGTAGLGITLVVLVDAWQQFVGRGAVLDGLSDAMNWGQRFRYRRQFQGAGVVTLLVGGALLHVGWKELRCERIGREAE
ncbi:MAG TPA: hypothetical protein VHN77_13740 [Phycisphaerales bacterium]|nr:hypothetical protein [Phycisphaerales bacterium]